MEVYRIIVEFLLPQGVVLIILVNSDKTIDNELIVNRALQVEVTDVCS